MKHDLTIIESDDGKTASGKCSCGKEYVLHHSGSGSMTGRGTTDRVAKSWTARKVVETDHKCHVAWMETQE